MTGGGYKQTIDGSTKAFRSTPAGRAWKLLFRTYAGTDVTLRAYAVCERN